MQMYPSESGIAIYRHRFAKRRSAEILLPPNPKEKDEKMKNIYAFLIGTVAGMLIMLGIFIFMAMGVLY